MRDFVIIRKNLQGYFHSKSVGNVMAISRAQDSRARGPGPEVIKLFSFSAQLRLKFILLIGILTFMSRINLLLSFTI